MPSGLGYKQALALRNAAAAKALALLAIDAQEPVVAARLSLAAGTLVKSWDAACDRMRIIRGNPLPGSRRPAAKPQRQPRRQSGLAAQPLKPPEPPTGQS